MLINLALEKPDSLETAQEKAQTLANQLNLNVLFYFDRIGYYTRPQPAPVEAVPPEKT